VAFELELIPTNSGSNTKKYKEMRIVHNTKSGLSAPQSFITKGKKRLKQNIDTVYLKNGDEFEIELYNPTQNKVLAKIELNGNSIGSGIILRPGERVFLERYLDVAKKFLFETYSVNVDDKQTTEAIQDNGDVTVKFFNESFYMPNVSNGLTWTNTGFNTGTTYAPLSGTYTPSFTTITSTSNSIGYSASTFTSGVNAAYLSNTVPVNSFEGPNKRSKKSKELETGRVEKGSNSNQTFSYDGSTFNTYSSWTNWWKIKPQSTAFMVREDLVTYCTECGSKRKKDSHKFCPHCGTKY
jgi:hypothetical protein